LFVEAGESPTLDASKVSTDRLSRVQAAVSCVFVVIVTVVVAVIVFVVFYGVGCCIVVAVIGVAAVVVIVVIVTVVAAVIVFIVFDFLAPHVIEFDESPGGVVVDLLVGTAFEYAKPRLQRGFAHGSA